jgi:hypothetical protein
MRYHYNILYPMVNTDPCHRVFPTHHLYIFSVAVLAAVLVVVLVAVLVLVAVRSHTYCFVLFYIFYVAVYNHNILGYLYNTTHPVYMVASLLYN